MWEALPSTHTENGTGTQDQDVLVGEREVEFARRPWLKETWFGQRKSEKVREEKPWIPG